MPLRDTATRLNAELAEQQVAAARAADKGASHRRRADLFRRNGAKWFGDLGQSMHDLANEFNQLSKDRTQHLKVDRQRPGSIEVEFINPVMRSIVEPKCIVSPKEVDLCVLCEFVKSVGSETRSFEMLPTEDHLIKVIVSIESITSHIAWPEDDGRKVTGDVFVDLRPYSEKTHITKKMDVKEFADFVLDSFINFKW